MPGSSPFIDIHGYQGTRDLAAFLAVPAAIEFLHQHDWHAIRHGWYEFALNLHQQLIDLIGMPELTPATTDWVIQMFTVQLPELDPQALQRTLLEEHNT